MEVGGGGGGAQPPKFSEPYYFKHVRISASAAVRMLTHAASGVDKGVRGARKMPLEVLGMLEASVDPEDDRCIMCVCVWRCCAIACARVPARARSPLPASRPLFARASPPLTSPHTHPSHTPACRTRLSWTRTALRAA
jgi:hypothetical protein